MGCEYKEDQMMPERAAREFLAEHTQCHMFKSADWILHEDCLSSYPA